MTDMVRRATLSQARAADPTVSAWVAANAGSGKTRVLTERVARLLLAGAKPERILCLTYTKAAAAEMADRLSRTLGRWALLDEASLRRDLAALDPASPPPEDLTEARRLFAQALETPGGLKIQTIHAFCDAALRRFPLEAGVSPAFTVLDEAATRALAAEARDALAEAAARGADDAFDRAAGRLTEEGVDALIRDVLANRALFADRADDATLCARFGLSPEALAETPFAGFFGPGEPEAVAEACAVLETGKKTDGDLAAALRGALPARDDAALEAALRAAFRAKDGKPRSLDRLPTKDVAAANPALRPFLHALADRFEAAAERAAAIDAARRTIDLNRFGAAFLDAFATAKRARGALDFDDLIERAAALLTEGDAAAWALWKLDGGIDHILVDEAQDTAPRQWTAIEALAGEIAAGEGARAGGRSLFVVGDEKQSIYSFQGAEPRLFGEMRGRFRAALAGAPEPLRETELKVSFRSGPAILRAVDLTFRPAADGLASDGVPPEHAAAKPDMPARVDLWPLIGKEAADAEPPWWAPLDAPAPTAPKLRLARMVAGEIARWTSGGERLPGGGPPVRPGDVMVLVRRRDLLAKEIVRDLKRRGVPVAGADRLRLADDLAVRDLLALARFALTPQDDLTLAAVLRSPLCGVSEAALFDVAHPRDGPLWIALRDARADHPEVVAFLERALAGADFLRPFEFLDRALREGGRARLLARLGTEAEEPVDELLAQALVYETTETPSLEGFLDWLARGGVEIRREMDKAAGAVRVMTVHGAKGLEAPVVVLPDTLSRGGGRPRALIRADGPGGPFAAWDASPPDAVLRAAREARERREAEEHRRLLYVAMTRAERWLIVCGAGDAKGETWHGLVGAGLEAAGAVDIDGPVGLEGKIRRLEDAGTAESATPDVATARSAPLLGWATARAPATPSEPPRRAASDLGGEAQRAATGADAETARRRGEAIHALLERLPALPPADRPPAAARMLSRLAPWADPSTRTAMAAEALAALETTGAEAVFSGDAMAEVAFSLRNPRNGGRIAGRVDRLAVGPDRVFAVDFKTDAAPPPPEAPPEPYLRQLAVYRAALTALHPGRRIEVGLLWTAAARLDLPDPRALDAALARALAEAAAP
ncbi:MAG: double-strand break repair helicase AddA [Rhodobacteraceae bacterium]|nr:MAG: double-strand break repair helicase AddA [Paracoccaceae bacterium]